MTHGKGKPSTAFHVKCILDMNNSGQERGGREQAEKQ